MARLLMQFLPQAASDNALVFDIGSIQLPSCTALLNNISGDWAEFVDPSWTFHPFVFLETSAGVSMR
jgi:hypothetical protein